MSERSRQRRIEIQIERGLFPLRTQTASQAFCQVCKHGVDLPHTTHDVKPCFPNPKAKPYNP